MANLRKSGAKDSKSYGRETGSAVLAPSKLQKVSTKEIVQSISGGGGGSGGRSISSVMAAAEAAEAARKAKLAAEQAAREEAAKKAAAEANRILQVKRQIIARGAQQRTRILRNQEGQRIQQTLINLKQIEKGRPTDVTIEERVNLDTGETTKRIREKRRAGERKRLTGEVSIGRGEVTNISKPTNNKITVTLRDGRKIRISATGNVTLGKSITGTKNLYFYNGQWVERPVSEGESIKSLKKVGIDTKKLGAAALKLRSNLIKTRNRLADENRSIPETQKNELAKVSSIIRQNQNLTEAQIQKQIRAEMTKNSIDKALLGLSNMANILFIKGATTLIDLGVATPVLLKSLRKEPLKTISALPGAVIDGVKQDWKTVKSKDGIAIAELAAEYYTMGKVFRIAGLAGGKTLRGVRRLLPGYIKMSNGKFIIKKPPAQVFKIRGKTRFLAQRVQKPSIKRPFSSVADFLKGRKPGQFKRFTKDPGLILKSQTVSSGGRPLSAQARLAGREVTAVNAAADQLTGWLKRKSIIRKPIPGEAKFPAKIKNILKKFDSGKKLTNKEFADVNKWLQKNVAPNITLLERSLYLDPASGLRLSRLGIQKTRTATLRDIVTGNFKLRTNKPQVLIFQNAKIAKFPKSLSKVKKKLISGKKLTTSETNQLIRWQVQTGSGKFKPVGSTIYAGGKELEVTLAPGELIKRIKGVGVTFVEGKKVTFVTAKVYKPSASILKQMKLAKLGRLSKTQLKKLESLLSKKLGRKIKVETPNTKTLSARASRAATRRADASIPVLRLDANGLRVLWLARKSTRRTPSKRKIIKRKTTKRTTTKRRAVAKRKPGKRTTTKRRAVKRTATRKSSKRKSAPRKKIAKRPIKRKPTKRKAIPRKPTPHGGRFSKTTKKQTPAPRLKLGFKRKTLSKSILTYYVVEKVRGKFKKLYPKALPRKDAMDYAVYTIDNRLSKTAFFIPSVKSKKIYKAPRSISGYASRNRAKVRPYKIRYGRKKLLVNGYIEKRKYFQDTKNERLQAAKLRAKKSKVTKRKPTTRKRKAVGRTAPRRKRIKRKPTKRKMTASQKKKMLANLRKARAARMKKLRRRKK